MVAKERPGETCRAKLGSCQDSVVCCLTRQYNHYKVRLGDSQLSLASRQL